MHLKKMDIGEYNKQIQNFKKEADKKYNEWRKAVEKYREEVTKLSKKLYVGKYVKCKTITDDYYYMLVRDITYRVENDIPKLIFSCSGFYSCFGEYLDDNFFNWNLDDTYEVPYKKVNQETGECKGFEIIDKEIYIKELKKASETMIKEEEKE